jgi:TatD DNase family protein
MASISDSVIEPILGIVETHCHLGDAQFDVDRNEVINRARAAGIAQMLVIGCDTTGIQSALELAEANDDIRAVIGIHPEAAGEWSSDTELAIRDSIAKCRANIAAVGEIGLDYHWETIPRETQKEVFTTQLDLADSVDLPVVMHCRDAYSDVLDILEERRIRRGVLHCFTSGHVDAERALGLGLHLGFGGVLTYKKSDELREIAASMPIDKILVETDCPYLAPQRFRGKRNEPAYVTEVVRLLAQLRGVSPEEMAEITARNAGALFGMVR